MTTEEKLNELIELIKFMVRVDDGINAINANIILSELDKIQEEI